MKNCLIGIFLIGLGAAALNCVNLAGGNGSETTNGLVVGQLLEDNGSPAVGTKVMFVAGNHDPVKDGPVPDSLTDTTDEAGQFRVRAAGGAAFNIEAFQPGSGNRALITGITVPLNDTGYIPACTMQKPGAITCFLTPPDSFNGYLYIPGTTRYAEIISGNAVIDSVPPGFIYSVRYSGTVGPAGGRVIAYDLTVFTGTTAVIADSSVWKYSKRFQLNTTGSGAGVSGAVVNFPALIRLNADNFDFSQARAEGGDLRFVKADGTALPYEIERWDPVTGLAEVWVKIDTVYGNDSTRYFTMIWGDSSSTSPSNGAAVFDTANGFQGVWHLGEAGNAIAKDATGNHYDGAPSDTAPAGAEGTIGPCRSFNGVSNGIRMNGTANSKLNFPEDGTYTVSAWAYADTLDNGYHMVAGKGNEQYFIGIKRSVPDTTMRWEFVEYHDKAGWNITEEYPSAKAWTYLVGVRKGTLQYLYVNGKLIDSSIFVSAATAPRNTGDDFTIGKFTTTPAYAFEGKCPFLGAVDEVRISNVNSSADWVKLCYMNQKERDALVKFK